jgi:hypothetical protein
MTAEEYLQFIWENQLFDHRRLRTTCGREIHVLSQGDQNPHAGPDFFNARIRIGSLLWAGNVEIHQRSSDWVRHGHHADPLYDNVILHVVAIDDAPAFNSRGNRVFSLVLRSSPELDSRYRSLRADESWLPCHDFIREVSRVRIRQWLSRLMAERLAIKTHRVDRLLTGCRRSWDETCYRVLASGFGLPINCLPFEMTVSGIPHALLIRLRDSLPDLEGILFGQAGFLPEVRSGGPYAADLSRRHQSYLRECTGRPISGHLWKFLRLRPASFPTLRISQFARLVQKQFPIMEPLLHTRTVAGMEQLFRVEASEYWNTHYLFGKCSPEIPKVLGPQSVRSLIINSVIPFLFAFGRARRHHDALQLGSSLLQEIEAESNSVITKWAAYGIRARGAFESQALIHLYNHYCKQKRCFDCEIGAFFFYLALYEESQC